MKKPLLALALLLTSHSLFAANVIIDGTTPDQVILHTTVLRNLKNFVSPIKKNILALHINLSLTAQKMLARNIAIITKQSSQISKNNSLPSQIENGMNFVPVLDQGMHGTCTTFATTAALDAAYEHGDYISQLCNLELGSYLHEQDPLYRDGWNGAFNQEILAQIEKYGVINTRFQKMESCAGVFEYPTFDEYNTGKAYSADEFTRHSEKIMATISTKPILKIEDAMSEKIDMEVVFNNTKQSLANGHRIIIGMLYDERFGHNGAEGSKKSPYDSWILTPSIIEDAKHNRIHFGHALVITGYDDDAIIAGSDGTKHKGVFTLRNSWGMYAGDHGSYYMSYDYFKALVLEAIEV